MECRLYKVRSFDTICPVKLPDGVINFTLFGDGLYSLIETATYSVRQHFISHIFANLCIFQELSIGHAFNPKHAPLESCSVFTHFTEPFYLNASLNQKGS